MKAVTVKHLILGLLMVLLCISLLFCKRHENERKLSNETTNAVTSPSPIIGKAELILDCSKSMQGFMAHSPLPQSPIQRLLGSEIIQLLAESGIRQLNLMPVGDTVGNSKPVRDLNHLSVFKDVHEIEKCFNADNTDLIDAFKSMNRLKVDVDILITDGVQDVRGVALHEGMIPGFDPQLFEEIKALVKNGKTIWLLGVLSPFAPINNNYSPLKPSADGTHHNIELPIDKDGKVKNQLRPLYLWVVGGDSLITSEICIKLVMSLQHLAGKDSVKLAPVSPMKISPGSLKFRLDDTDQRLSSMKLGDRAWQWRIMRSAPDHDEMCIPMDIEGSIDSKEFSLYNLHITPHNQWAYAKKDASGLSLCIKTSMIPGSTNFGCSSISSEIIVELDPVWINQRGNQPWWESWSTDDDTKLENIGKTLYLNRLNPMIENAIKLSDTIGSRQRLSLDIRARN